jgi:hypothetical protein
MKEHRHTHSITLRASDHNLMNQIPADKSTRVMVFCVADGHANPRDIAFPHNSEIKVNTGEIKANLRGLKNKPGTTRPVDITDSLRLKPPQYLNTVELTYALSDKGRDSNFIHVSSEELPSSLTVPIFTSLCAEPSSHILTFITEVLLYGSDR